MDLAKAALVGMQTTVGTLGQDGVAIREVIRFMILAEAKESALLNRRRFSIGNPRSQNRDRGHPLLLDELTGRALGTHFL
jgi:hypothetical protein